MPILDNTFWHNPLRSWLVALVLVLVVSVGLRLLMRLLTSRLGKLAAKTENQIDDVVIEAVGRTLKVTYLILGLTAAAAYLTLPPRITLMMRHITISVLLIQAGLWVSHAAAAWLRLYRSRQLETDRGAATAVGAMTFLVQAAIWIMVMLITLGNLGFNVTALITGLGIGGIAVALALQSVLSDLFASLAIVFDKPFVIGDFIIVGEQLGVVENVGLKTTRIRSLSGEQIAFANSDVLSSRIRNFGRMYERRVVFQLGVTYQTQLDDLKAIPGMIKEAIEAQDKARFDRSHFAKYGDFAQIFESVYYVLAPDYNLYMDIQQAINLQVRERFEAAGIDFAYPTQTIYLEGGEAPIRYGKEAEG